jgi:hypothetical protein
VLNNAVKERSAEHLLSASRPTSEMQAMARVKDVWGSTEMAAISVPQLVRKVDSDELADVDVQEYRNASHRAGLLVGKAFIAREPSLDALAANVKANKPGIVHLDREIGDEKRQPMTSKTYAME